MKTKFFNSLMSAILLAVLFSGLISMVTAVPFLVPFTVLMALSFAVGALGAGKPRAKNMAFDGLFKEVWLDDIMEGFWDGNDFFADGEDWDGFVENDTINLSEVGAAPNVRVNSTTYPVPIAERTDTPSEVVLKRYETENTVHRNLSGAIAYKKQQSIITQHRSSLLQKIADDGMYALAPVDNTENGGTVILTTGANDVTLGVKLPTDDDFARLATMYDEKKWNGDRVLNMPPAMFWKYVTGNTVLKAQAERNGAGGRGTNVFVEYFSFTIRSRNTYVRYNASGVKQAQGAVTGLPAAVAYVKGTSFGRGLGTPDMYASLKDVRERGDVIGFGLRAIIARKRTATTAALAFAPNA